MRFLIFFITFSISASFVWAQTNCVENLEKAQDAFEAGRIEEIPALLNNCIRNEYNSEQKGLAYKLLAITFLYDKNELKADEAMLQLLRTDPLFKPDLNNDPSEFISLYNSFRTNPILIAGFSVGASLFSIRDVSRFGVENLASETESYTGRWGLTLGVDLELPLDKKWSAFSSLSYSTKKYSILNSLMSFNELQVEETQNWIDLYLMGQYYFGSKGIRPFIRIGGYGGCLLSAHAIYVTNQEDLNDIEGPAENIKELRTHYNYGLAADVGISRAIGRSVVDFTIRTTYAFGNYVNEDSRYGALGNKLALTYGYRDNDFYANFLAVSLGYKLMIFKPKKLF